MYTCKYLHLKRLLTCWYFLYNVCFSISTVSKIYLWVDDVCVMDMQSHVTEIHPTHVVWGVNVNTTRVENSVRRVVRVLYRNFGCLPKLDIHLFVNVSLADCHFTREKIYSESTIISWIPIFVVLINDTVSCILNFLVLNFSI